MSQSRLCWAWVGFIWVRFLTRYSASHSYLQTITFLYLLSSSSSSTSTRMQALHEPGKKTSIVSLLNPQDASVSQLPYTAVSDAGGDANQSHSYVHRAVGYGHTYPASDYSLRKATWEPDDRASYTIDDYHRHSEYTSYHQPSRMTTSHSPDSYYNHPQYHYPERHIMRSDRVEERYFENGHHWHQQTYPNSCHYPAATPLSFSHENGGKIAFTSQND